VEILTGYYHIPAESEGIWGENHTKDPCCHCEYSSQSDWSCLFRRNN
jgi:Aspartate/tyrosine/aromatic aminotransferase